MFILLIIYDALIKFSVNFRIQLFFVIDLMISGFPFHLSFAYLKEKKLQTVHIGLYKTPSLCIE